MSRRALGAICVALALVACSSPPPAPDWQLSAKSSLDRAVAAYLVGDTHKAMTELERAREEIGRTGRIDLLARAELRFCAAQVASLVFESCPPFDKLRADSPEAERAYADYLAARIQPESVALLPPAQRSVVAKGTNDEAAAAAVKNIEDPFSRLVAAGVLFQANRASPAVLDLAVETASAQGWRRPLLAYLRVQRLRADKAGDSDAADRFRRRIDVIEQTMRPPAR
jgi:hypothetical protein